MGKYDRESDLIDILEDLEHRVAALEAIYVQSRSAPLTPEQMDAIYQSVIKRLTQDLYTSAKERIA